MLRWFPFYSLAGAWRPLSAADCLDLSIKAGFADNAANRRKPLTTRTNRPPRRHMQGWGLQALERLPAGAFVCEYAGEPIATPEARRRLAAYDSAGSGHALLAARLVLPSGRAALRINVDATRRGNVARWGLGWRVGIGCIRDGCMSIACVCTGRKVQSCSTHTTPLPLVTDVATDSSTTVATVETWSSFFSHQTVTVCIRECCCMLDGDQPTCSLNTLASCLLLLMATADTTTKSHSN
jgi:hypothetical protein